MPGSFQPEKDIRIKYRQDAVQNYMSPNLQWSKPHFHYLFEMIVVEDGWVDFIVGDKSYHLVRGSLLFISNLENHSISGSSPNFSRYAMLFSNDCLMARIKSPVLLSIFKQHSDDFCHMYQCSDREFKNILNLCKIIYEEYTRAQPFWDSMLMSKLYAILVRLFRVRPEAFPATARPASQSIVFDIQNHISRNLTENLSLGEVADQFYINKFHLSHIFKQITGYNFKEYIILERISKAKDMLLNDTLSVNSISQEVGFHSSTHFIRTFNRLEGISPNQYRKSGKSK